MINRKLDSWLSKPQTERKQTNLVYAEFLQLSAMYNLKLEKANNKIILLQYLHDNINTFIVS